MTALKKNLIIVLSLIMVFSSFPFNSYAAVKVQQPKLTASSTVNTVTLKWKKVKNAKYYQVYSYNSKSKKYKKISGTKSVNYKVKKLKAGTTYKYAVKAFINKKRYSKYSKIVTVSTIPKAPSGLKATPGEKTVKLTWNKSSGAVSYTVKISQNSDFKTVYKSVNVKNGSYTFSGLEGKKYYARVYAVKTLGKKAYISAPASVSFTVSDYSSTVNTSIKYQTIDGFGASACWWGHKVGGWDSCEDIIKYLYDREEGIGLNIYRYNVGAGSRDDETINNYWSRTESFAKSYNSDYNKIFFDWSKDAEAQNTLSIAKKLYGDDLRVVLFANSPPTCITRNGRAYCDPDPTHSLYENIYTNILPDKYPVYAQYFTDIADHFVNEGYRVVDISPVNEPQYRWACNDEKTSMSQEGCHYGPIKLSQMLVEFVKACNGKPYRVSMFEAGGATGEDTEFKEYLKAIMDNQTNASYFNSVTVHSYWHSKYTKKKCFDYVNKDYPGMTIACTEYCQMTGDRNTGVYEISSPIDWWLPERNGMTIDYGVHLARTVNEDLTTLNATEWNWWTGVSNGYYPDGLVYIDHEDNDKTFVETSKRLWCLGNYSKYIDEGAVRVKISEAQSNIISSAFVNPDKSLVAVYVNTDKYDKKVKLKAGGYNTYSLYETSETKNLENTYNGAYSDYTEIKLPSYSVITVVLK